MKKIIFTAALSLLSVNQSFAKTYRELFTSGDRSIKKSIGNRCYKKVKQLFKEGGSLKSSTMTPYLKPLLDFSYRSGSIDRTFYHYTDSKKAMQNATNNDSESQFDFLRKLHDHTWYVAEDPLTSAHFGDIQVKIHLRPDKKVLGYQWINEFDSKNLIEHDLARKFGSACESVSSDLINKNFLYLLYLEENDVALIDYYSSTQWFQVVSEAAVESIEIGTKGTW